LPPIGRGGGRRETVSCGRVVVELLI